MTATVRAFALSVLVYVVATVILGRDVLAHLSTGVLNDAGDPLLNAAILRWGATHAPWTAAWRQMPSFYPTAGVLLFSEHLLGLGWMASPLYWITGDTLVTYNLTTLLTWVLCGAAMYALVFRLTGSAAAAFLSGIAFGFAPYRVSQMPHVQMLAVFYAPVALLGLHAFVDTGRRRWLVVYGAAWLLQCFANGYMVFFFSLVVGAWILWFVVASRRWRALAWIAVATTLVAVPLLPILDTYKVVHETHGFVRSIDEATFFSADITGVLCAPGTLTIWSVLRIGCRAEGELFPGVTLFLLFMAGTARALGVGRGLTRGMPRPLRIVTGLLFAAAAIYLTVAISVWLGGPWRLALGPIRASASSASQAVILSLATMLLGALLTPALWTAVRRAYVQLFYILAAVLTWVLALGPYPKLMGAPIDFDGPFLWLARLPGFDGVRVPARFWMMTVLCLAVVAGLVVAEWSKGKSRRVGAVLVGGLAVALFADGWVHAFRWERRPDDLPNPSALAGRTVLELPMDDAHDIAAQYRAISGGWRSVNGYSGYFPNYYSVLREAVRHEATGMLWPFQALGELDVVVSDEAPRLQTLLETQPGVASTGRNGRYIQYRLPMRPWPRGGDGALVAVSRLDSTCASTLLAKALDRDRATRWICGPEQARLQVVVDVGSVRPVGALVHNDGEFFGDYPRSIVLETSTDGAAWTPAWAGDVTGPAIHALLERPREMRIVFPFEPRPARFIRLTHPAQDEKYYWSIAEIEIREH